MSRYLDPSRRWDAGSQARLRRRLEANPQDRSEYERVIVLHRLLAGGDPREPSRVEDDRRLTTLLERFAAPGATQAIPTPHPRSSATRPSFVSWFTGLAGVCAALALVIQSGSPAPSSGWHGLRGYGDDIRARGADDGTEELVGYGVTGVTESGQEYEVVAAARAYRDDYLRFSYTNDRPSEIGHLFLFGIQRAEGAGVAVRWYAPEPGYGEAQSAAIPAARARFFDFETQIAVEHTTGALRFVGIFSQSPLDLTTMREALSDVPASEVLNEPASGFEAWLRVKLGIAPSARIQIHDATVVPGSQPTALKPVEGR